MKGQTYQLAVLPWGATEAHNFHLPYGTDAYLAEHVAIESAGQAWEKGARPVVLPCVPYGVNTGQLEVPFCMNFNPSTQKIVLADIITVLLQHGVNKLVIVNAHGGNNFQPIVRELNMQFPTMIICVINWWKVCKVAEYFDNPGDHADEMETSSLMAIKPELILPLELAGDGAETPFALKGLREKWAWVPRRWVYVSKDTGVGDPSLSTPEKGTRFVTDSVRNIGDFLVELAQVQTEKDLYHYE